MTFGPVGPAGRSRTVRYMYDYTDDFHCGDKVLVGVDGSAANRPALLWALAEAKARHEELIAAYAWQVPSFAYYSPGYVPIVADDLAEEGHKLVGAAVGDLARDYEVKIEVQTAEGPAHRVIRRLADEPGVGLVVVGRRGHGAVASVLLGSTSHSLSHHSPKPLVIVPAPRERTASIQAVRHILVGVDGSDGAIAALRWAAREATLHGALLEVAVAWPWTTAPRHLVIDAPIEVNLELAAREVLTQALDSVGLQDLKVRLTVREGPAPEVLLDLSESADMLVVGTRGRGRSKEMFLGSTSHLVAHRSTGPVAIIPSATREGESR